VSVLTIPHPPKRPARKAKLTELAVRKLKSEAAPFVIWDSHQHGLAIRVQPTGGKSFYVVYSRHGRPRWYRIGSANAIGLADARKHAARVLLEVINGKDPAAEKKAERGAGTFAELAARYVETYAKKRNKSWAQADRLVQRYLIPSWGKLLAPSITRADVKAMMARIEARALANQVIAAASAIFSWAVKEEILPANPCRGVDRNETTSRERILSDSEVPQFWAAFEDAGVYAPALKVLLLTGQRPGEVACMRLEHIKDGWWEMPGAPVPELGWPGTKNKQNHRVWLSASVCDIIAEFTEGETNGFVFAGAVRGGHLGAAMREICAKLRVADKVTPHDLRRSFLSRVTGLSFGRDAMDRIANHKEKAVTDVYDRHNYAKEDEKITETVGRHIIALATGEAEAKVVPFRR
jgi:integrase